VRVVSAARLSSVVLLCLIGTTVKAQKTTFSPGIQVSAGYTDNLGFGGEANPSDYFGLLQVFLPVYRSTRTQQLGFNYRPRLFRYDEFTNLDRDEHDLFFGIAQQYSNRRRLNFELRWINTQVQGDPVSTDDSEFFLDQRSDRQLFRGRFDWRQPLARRWFWRANVIGAYTKLDPVSESQEIDPRDFENRTQYSAAIRFSREMSRL